MKFGLTKKMSGLGSELELLEKNISTVFDEFFNVKTTGLFESDWVPEIDIRENEKEIHVKAAIPGIDEKDLNVNIEENILNISGEKKEERNDESNDKKSVVSEIRYGSFSRSVRLPEGIKSDKIKAEFKKGVLDIRIPKEKTVESKKIKIDIN